MQKTRKSIARKFKVTGSGKVIYRTPGRRHLLRNKTRQQDNRAANDKVLSEGFARIVRQAVAPSGK